GIYVGEAAHQLRSALDHIMFIFCSPTTEQEERRVQFPLVESPEHFVGKIGRGTAHMMPSIRGGIGGPVWTLIESLQPYHSGKRPETELLGQIQVIDNWDKHRRILTAAASATGIDMNILNKSGATIEHQVFHGILEPGAMLASGTIKQPSGSLNVVMQPELALLPVFDKRMAKEIQGRPVINLLRDAA